MPLLLSHVLAMMCSPSTPPFPNLIVWFSGIKFTDNSVCYGQETGWLC